MKRTSFIVCFLILCAGIQAQVLNDSTVQVLAYWDMGDKYEFEHTEKNYKVEKGDTIFGDCITETFELAVIDSTETSYTLRYTMLTHDAQIKDSIGQELSRKLHEVTQGIPIDILTDQYGTFQDIVNWDELQITLNKAFDIAKGELRSYFQSIYPDSISRRLEPMIERTFEPFRNKQTLIGGMKYITQLFYYHGISMNTGMTYSWDEQIQSMFDGSPVDVMHAFELDEIREDDASVVLYAKSVYDSDQLVKSYLNYLKNILGAEAPDIPQNPERPYIFLTDSTTSIIDVDWGWTLYTLHHISSWVGETETVKEWEVVMK